jgi:DNA-binding MarR family transcriptional regulator
MSLPASEMPQRLQERADYLVSLMPRLGKSLHTRVSQCKFSLTHDLTEGQMALLFFLGENGPANMRELARMGQVAMSTMTEIVDRMVKLKLVSREQDKKDRRSIRVRATPAGRRAFKAKFNNAREIFRQLLASLSEQDQKELIRAFQSIERLLLQPQQV